MADHTSTTRPLDKAGLALLTGAVVMLYLLAALGTNAFHLPGRTTAETDFTQILSDLPRGEGGHYSARVLHEAFDRMGYRLDAVATTGGSVPPLLLARMPRDLARLAPIDLRKRLFLRVMLPLVLHVNEGVLRDRTRLLAIRDDVASGTLDDDDAAWLAETAERYLVPTDDVGALLERVDIVPVSLALAQAAEESGWGTSRFAREGNALFGQWTFAEDGLAPKEAQGSGHRVRSFATLAEAVRAYIHNLNTHRAYSEFRRRRAAMRTGGHALDGDALAGSLHRYSERRGEYVNSLRSIIRANDLRALDGARLAPMEAVSASY